MNESEDEEERSKFAHAKKLCYAPILELPEGSEDFVVYCDASLKGFGAVLMQREKAEETYLYGTKCEVYTIKMSLQYTSNQKEVNMKDSAGGSNSTLERITIARTVIHPGKANVVADAY
ncbi:putative reverse transcriptase domain-containing protein [Tanacetum coccineum]|uniref:Reverse transcriptase domain-containing protein n=1 Tax=Tanacetum coccineum TaxID=301880 RepID=A0ABQ5BZP8_9ASTR